MHYSVFQTNCSHFCFCKSILHYSALRGKNVKKYCTMTCYASNMMHDLAKANIISLLQPRKLSESWCFNVPLLYWKKLNLILQLQVAMLNE